MMKYFLLAILMSCCIISNGQDAHLNQIPLFKQITHPFMPPITSEYFFFSEDGLLWFSTAQGLTSFDGSDIVYHSSLQQSNSFFLSRIFAMAEDRNHNFYIGTPTGFYFFNRLTKSYKKFEYTYRDNNKPFVHGINAIFCDKTGIVYAGAGAGGLYIYDPRKNILKHYNLDDSKPDSWESQTYNSVISFASHATDSNKIWLGTFHGIYLFDKPSRRFSQNFELVNIQYHKFASPSDLADPQFIDVQRMDVANDSIIWFNSWAGGFAKYNTSTGKAMHVFGRDALYKGKDLYYGFIIPKFARLGKEKYLLGIYNGKTAIFDTRTNAVTFFSVTANNFPEEQTRFVTNDRKGNVWLLQRGSLYATIPSDRRLQAIEVPKPMQVNFSMPKIRGIYFDTTDHLYYCAFLGSAGIHVYDSNFTQQKLIPTSIINNFYNLGSTIDMNMSKDGAGRLWTVGWKNHVMLPGEKRFTLIEKKFPSLAWIGSKGEFRGIVSTRDGNILLKQDRSMVYQVNYRTLVVDTIRCPQIKSNDQEIKDASTWYDEKRNFVYLVRNEGIAQFDLDKKEMKIVPHNSLFGGYSSYQGVCAPSLDVEGNILFMLPKYGIRIIDPVSLSCVDSIHYGDKGLMRGDYTAIIGAANHHILFRSQNGIVIYDYAKKQSFLFDRSNGLSSPDNKSFLYCNGRLFIGQTGRIEYFNVSDLDNYSSILTPYLNSIYADSVPVFTRTGVEQGRQKIKLSWFQNTLAFSFSAPEFFFPERIEYAYQLAPVDKDWHYSNYFNRKITYSSLAPGKYTFSMKSQLAGGNWNEEPVKYTVIIVPAWWQTNFFQVISLLLGAVVVLVIVRWRIRNIRKAEQEKSKQEKRLLELEAKALRAQMNPHFIFNCLNSIKALIRQQKEEKSVTYLTTFAKLIRTLFNNADKKEISLYDEIETCKLYLQLEAMRFDTKFSYSVTIDEHIDLKSVQVPALIVQPFIENAIWHGIVPCNNGGKVRLEVVEKNDSIEIIIDDDGIGREASRLNGSASGLAHHSKGINLTQSRIELNNLLQQRQAKLQVIDKKDADNKANGTTVIITVKQELS